MGDYTTDVFVVVSRNWDLDDHVSPFTRWYVLTVYRPSAGSNCVATWVFAGMRPETLMNSKGLFIADDYSGIVEGDLAGENRLDLIMEFFRYMLDYSDLKGLDAGIWDMCLENGGARFCHSELFGEQYSLNYQVVFLPASRTLWMKTMDKDWQKVELGPLFGN